MLKHLRIEKMDFLIGVYIFCICATELMGGKTFPLFNIGSYTLNASVAILLLPLVFSVNDIIAEVHGKERARRLVRTGLMVVIFVLLFSVLATSLQPSVRFSSKEAAYDTIFQTSARIALASLIAFSLAEFLDVYIFTKLKQKLGVGKLWLRNNASNFLSQLVDTVVFMVLAFYAFDKGVGANASFLISLILPYWLLKCAMSIIETPFVYLGVRWLKRQDSSLKITN